MASYFTPVGSKYVLPGYVKNEQWQQAQVTPWAPRGTTYTVPMDGVDGVTGARSRVAAGLRRGEVGIRRPSKVARALSKRPGRNGMSGVLAGDCMVPMAGFFDGLARGLNTALNVTGAVVNDQAAYQAHLAQQAAAKKAAAEAAANQSVGTPTTPAAPSVVYVPASGGTPSWLLPAGLGGAALLALLLLKR
jgi:hypothetical protein